VSILLEDESCFDLGLSACSQRPSCEGAPGGAGKGAGAGAKAGGGAGGAAAEKKGGGAAAASSLDANGDATEGKDNTQLSAMAENAIEKEKARREKQKANAQPEGWFDLKTNTSVYVTGRARHITPALSSTALFTPCHSPRFQRASRIKLSNILDVASIPYL